MRGHEAVIAMRRAGYAPLCVWVHDLDGYTDSTHPTKGWATHTARAEVELLPTDSPTRLDLRFCVGLTVYLQCHDRRRMEALEQNLIACGAARVLGALFRPGRQGFDTVALTDTDGLIVLEEEHGSVAA